MRAVTSSSPCSARRTTAFTDSLVSCSISTFRRDTLAGLVTEAVKVNVKVAFDVYEPTHYHLYAQTAALASQYFREGNIADYMRVPELLRNAL